MRTKRELRKEMRLKRNSFSETTAMGLSQPAQRHILADSAWKKAGAVGLYSPINREMDTTLLKTSAWEDGKKTFFPYTESEGVISLLPCSDDKSFVKGAFGILEPSPETCPLPTKGEWKPDIIIVPGLAFDKKGFRVGSGGGYYDRLFSNPSMQSIVRIGFCYGFQVVDEIQTEEWDVPMHAIVTEEGITWLEEEGSSWF